MDKKSIAALSAALVSSMSVSGCYVIPIESHPAPVPGATAPVAAAYAPAVLQARLYPLNETAGKMGPLQATVLDNLRGHATFSVNEGGEVLQGEATRVAGDYPGFGRIHREVYGQGSMPSGQRGIASAAGSRGSFVNCEYALSTPSRGTGACLFSNGAKYQMHFGS